MKDIIFGVIGGLVGAAVWAGVAFVTQYEVGWIAWGIGALVGYCVAFGNQDRGRSPTAAGVIAVAITMLSIAGGKYAAVGLMMPDDAELVDMFMENFDDTDYVVSYIADDVVSEYEKAGREMEWPEGAFLQAGSGPADYPSEVWAEASDRWDAMTESERTSFRDGKEAEARANLEASLPQLRAVITAGGFLGSFTPMDLLFFGLAAVTAWGVGSGRKSREELEAAYRGALLTTMLRVSTADGSIQESEVEAIRTVLRDRLGAEVEASAIREDAGRAAGGSEELLTALRALSPHLDTDQREGMVRSAVQVALADGTVGPDEQRLIEEIASAVDVSEAHLRGILSHFAAEATA